MNAMYTKVLSRVSADDFNTVGGKGANLGEMIGAGLPVPGGFVVLTGAYDRFVEANGLSALIDGLLSGVAPDDIGALDEATGRIRQAFSDAPIPVEVAREIRAAYGGMNDATVAIRSSSTAEDLPGLSFAGQYSTYLNIKGTGAVLDYVRQCWASLWNSRAVAYRIRENIGTDTLAHAVVVQTMVDAEKAGILFTANPVNGRRDQMLLNASWGLGEAIVGGEVNPDQWILFGADGSVLEERPARKEVMTVRREGGIDLVAVPEEQKEQICLNREDIGALHRFAQDVQRWFRSPQDIEWAFADGQFWLVQTRPITSLYPQPAGRPGKEGFRVHLNFNNYSQAMKEPFTPMGEELIRAMLGGMIAQYGKKNGSTDPFWWYQNLGGRVFIDITDFMRTEKSWEKFRKEDSNDKDPLTTKALLQLVERNREHLIDPSRAVNLKKMVSPKLIRLLATVGRRYMVGVNNPQKARDKAVALGEETVVWFREALWDLDTTEEKLRWIEDNARVLFINGFGLLSYVMVSSTYMDKARAILMAKLGDASDLHDVEKSVPHSVTTQMGMKLLHLAKQYAEGDKRPSAGDPEIREFLATYGHRSAVELDVGVPTWTEEPQYVLDLINTYIDNNNYQEGIDRFHQGEQDAEAAIVRIREKLTAAGHRRAARRTEKMLRDFREMFGIRELSKFVLTQALQILREMLLSIGREMVASGQLAEETDIFFLTMADIRMGGDLRDLAAHNREQFAINMKRKAPRILTSTGEAVYGPAAEGNGQSLVGIPVSPGVHEGAVRVIERPEDGHRLEKGDVLVTTGTNPAWTPLFLKLGALVMETGGSISHGSVVAREYGLPAVAGVNGVTGLLKDGQRVRVNGETGQVELI